MKILIGTPASNGMVTIEYCRSLIDIIRAFDSATPNKLEWSLRLLESTLLPFARNSLASEVLSDRSYTHLLFIDADMGFRPQAIAKLLAADKPLIGCLCPSRVMDLGRFHNISRKISDPIAARNIGANYAATSALQKKIVKVSGKEKAQYVVDGGLIRTLHMGMAITLIKREVFDIMEKKIPNIVINANNSEQYKKFGHTGKVIQCFSEVNKNNHILSEDLSFCHRWIEVCGGEIWGIADEEIVHVGKHAFTGRLLDRLEYEDDN